LRCDHRGQWRHTLNIEGEREGTHTIVAKREEGGRMREVSEVEE